MKYTVLLPILDETIGLSCIKSMQIKNNSSGFDLENITIVDNTRNGLQNTHLKTYRDPDNHNIGVSGAWNVGARDVVENKKDYMIILSASMLFGPELHITFIEQMNRHPEAMIVESEGHSWHLIAIHRKVFETIGYFDENFYPGYFEQIDFCRRMDLANFDNKGSKEWANVWVNALSTGVGQHIQFLSLPADPLLAYYREKWGGNKGEEKYDKPFGDKPLDYFPDFTIEELVKKYGLDKWW